MTIRKLPTLAYLGERLVYDRSNGILTWRERPRSDFSSNRGWNTYNARFAGKQAGTISYGRHGPRLQVCIDYRVYFAHRIIFKLETGLEPDILDHKDGNTLNNRFDNLRAATSSQNSSNRLGTARSGFKGVVPNGNGWLARIQFRRKVFCLGNYDTPEEASAAYTEAAKRIHGEFANSGHQEK